MTLLVEDTHLPITPEFISVFPFSTTIVPHAFFELWQLPWSLKRFPWLRTMCTASPANYFGAIYHQ